MYTQLVVGFNCDIYGMRESNICAPFLLCQSFPEDSFFPFFFPEQNRPLIVTTTGESICQVVFFPSCKLVSLEEGCSVSQPSVR